MGLFTRKKNDATTGGSTRATTARVTDRDLSGVLMRPLITEKAVGQSTQGVYVFVVRPSATKFDVRDAIVKHYGVTPAKVRVVNRAPAERLAGARGRMKKVPGQKKAYVQLKKGDSINLV